jgi:tRNA pseudouridine38-40 synthase
VIDPTQSGASLRNWKLTVAYDGTDFSGWQIQPGEPTVQGELQAALQRVLGETPLPQGSGRTDAGVHALGQVASFELAASIPAENLQHALNRTLPGSIRILDAQVVPASFHARHSALAKSYEYRVFRERVCPPFLSRYAHACAWPMDLEVLEKAAQVLVGEHDFLSFAATDPDKRARDSSIATSEENDDLPATAIASYRVGAIRTIYSSHWSLRRTEEGDFLIYRVRGNGFLHHMVRNLVGTMLDIGRGHVALDTLPAILAARARSAAGPTAPACGLFLHSVEYPGA